MIRARRIAAVLVVPVLLASCDAPPAPGAGEGTTASATAPAFTAASASSSPSIASAAPTSSSSASAATKSEAPARPPPPPPCPEKMVLVPGGKLSTLERGADVEVPDTCIDVHEVSVAEFRDCVEHGACARDCGRASKRAEPAMSGRIARGPEDAPPLPPPLACSPVPVRTDWGPEIDIDVSRFCNGNHADRDDHPVNCVSFEEAESYCVARGARLPTGDEWEWASKGGPSRLASPWGGPVATDQICWGRPFKRSSTCRIGSFPRDLTPQGLAEMGGSVTEWTEPPRRAGRHTEARWAYGASWYAIDDGYARAALGGVQMPGRRTETVGFRCAADPRR